MIKQFSLAVAAATAGLCSACGAATVTVTATERPSPTAVATPTPAAKPVSGTITGSLIYPASVLPAQHVVAFPVVGGHPQESGAVSITTAAGVNTYSLTVPAGTYVVMSYVSAGGGVPSSSGAAYDQAVICSHGDAGVLATCTDTTLVQVTVNAGQTVTGVNPYDWYNQGGAWPSEPA